MSAPSPDPGSHLQSRSDGRLLVLAAILGAPISAAAYGFLAVVASLQQWIFTDLPMGSGFDGTPLWSLRLLPLAGLLVGLAIRYLRGTGGHVPVVGLKSRGAPAPVALPGVVAAALASLSVGVVPGPEAPLITLDGGLAVCAVRLAIRPMPPQTAVVVAATGLG